MKIEFVGHATFLITTSNGTRILTDPINYATHSDQLRYKRVTEPVDVVTVSHEHGDHSGYRELKGSPVVIKAEGKFAAGGAQFTGFATWHDEAQGSKRGSNIVFVISADDLRVAHMGDLGHVLSADQAAAIGNVDVMLVPVGGYYTIDGAGADTVARQLAADIVIPMHFKTDRCEYPIAGVDGFVAGKPNVTRVGGSELEITRESLPPKQQIFVLEPAE